MKFKSILIAACAALLAGCATAPTTTTTTPLAIVADPQVIQAVVAMGTAGYAAHNPSSLPDAQLILDVLNQYTTGQPVTSSEIEAALTAAGAKAQNQQQYAILAKLIGSELEKYLPANATPTQMAQFNTVLTAIVAGLNEGLKP